MLAGELALAGVDVVIVERRADQVVEGSRAGGLLPRTIEVLGQRGIAQRFIDAGYTVATHGFAALPFDISDLPSRHNYVLALFQSEFEPILAEWVTSELNVPILRQREVVNFEQHDNSVDLLLSDNSHLRAQYLIGCDGARSVIRKQADIDFVGLDASTSWMIAEAQFDGEPEFGMRRDSVGTHAIGRAADGASARMVFTERDVQHATEPTIDDLRRQLIEVYGNDFGLRSATWISRFNDTARQAASYRDRRVLLAGDAAHIHPPHGGQGMGTGIQDAVNLGWKLAQVINGLSSDALLDTYHAERHPVAARVLHNTLAQVALSAGDDRTAALRDVMGELLAVRQARHRIGAMLCGLDIHYDLGEGHPLLGRRMPDFDVLTEGGATCVYDLLHDAHGVVLDFTGTASFDMSPWATRVRLVRARYDGTWELPVIGAVDPVPAVLIRPDGYVAWTGTLTDAALPDAVARWFGRSREVSPTS